MPDVVMDDSTLAGLLGRVVEQRFKLEAARAAEKSAKEELDRLEDIAAQALVSAGIDGIRCHGFSWWTTPELFVSVPAANRDAVIAAAASVGLDAVQVATAKVKGYLAEEAKKRREAGELVTSPSEGTPFAGLVSEFVKVGLNRRAV